MHLVGRTYTLLVLMAMGLANITQGREETQPASYTRSLLLQHKHPEEKNTVFKGLGRDKTVRYVNLLSKLSDEPLPGKSLSVPAVPPKPTIHPRRKLLEEAPLHTERSWLYSAIIPGLGQAYNKNYWRCLIIYGVFGGLIWGAVYNHDEYMTAKREFIEKNKKLKKKNKDLSASNLGNFMEGRKRDRTIFMVAMGVWHVINIFDAYAMGSLNTFDVSDDLAVVIKPTEPSVSGLGVTFSLQPKQT